MPKKKQSGGQLKMKRRLQPPTFVTGQMGGSWLGDQWSNVKRSHIIRNVAGAAGGVFGGPIGAAAAYGAGELLGLGKKPGRKVAGRRSVLKF